MTKSVLKELVFVGTLSFPLKRFTDDTMLHILTKLRQIFPRLNDRAFDENDCWTFCKRRRIIVKKAPLIVPGYFGTTTVRNKKRYFILLDERLTGVQLLRTFLHEIGHVALHEPLGDQSVLYFKNETAIENKQDNEAEIFMLLALLPTRIFLELAELPHDQPNPYPVDLLIKRQRLFEVINQ